AVLRLVLVKGLALTAAGVALGLVAAFELTRLLGYLPYRVSPRDPLSFVSALAVILLASLPACLVPALRATRTDPILVLRGWRDRFATGDAQRHGRRGAS